MSEENRFFIRLRFDSNTDEYVLLFDDLRGNGHEVAIARRDIHPVLAHFNEVVKNAEFDYADRKTKKDDKT